MIRTVADYFDDNSFLTIGMRKIRGRYYYPIESSYYNDGFSLSRQYICGRSFLQEEHGMFWVPVYLMTWCLDADPERDAVSRLEKDPYRKYNISYHVEYNQIEYRQTVTTFEWTHSGWRMKDPNGDYWIAEFISTPNNDRKCFIEEGYQPSLGEYQAQCELKIEDRQTENFIAQLIHEDVALQNRSNCNNITSECFDETRNAVYELAEKVNPAQSKRFHSLYVRFDRAKTCYEVLSMQRLIRESCSSYEQYKNLFQEQWQVSAKELTEFTRVMSLDLYC